MFTGIVEEIGVVKKIEKRKNLVQLAIAAKKARRLTRKGDSIAINGVCLTVTRLNNSVMTFDVMKETLNCTTLKNLKKSNKVNCERALTPQSRISGHFVTGHIDHVGIIKDVIIKKNNIEFHITPPQGIRKYIVPKGSICIDGVSLTVGKVHKTYFSVYLIPFTNQVTTLGIKQKGEHVNIETDILAKYILDHG